MAMKDFFKKLLGQSNDAEVRRLQKIADSVLALEDKYKGLSDEELQRQTPILKERLHKGETVDDILPDAFAAFREAVWRVDGKRLFPVQIMGGICLHQGRIADPHRHPARLPERPDRRRRAYRYRQRLSSQISGRVDGQHLPLHGHERGHHRS